LPASPYPKPLTGDSAAVATQLVICPGLHPPESTSCFLGSLQTQWQTIQNRPLGYLVAPVSLPIYSPPALLTWLQQHCDPRTPLLLLGFSAGVVGAIGAAWGWQLTGGKVAALIALDGWGVGLYGNFPVYRLSHDEFTHWSSHVLGGGSESFYAQPSCTHLDLWSQPEQAQGYWVTPEGKTPTQAAEFLVTVLQRYA
jgi:hypothetical protein